MHDVLTTARGDILTLGAVFAVYFSSSGIESLRIGLNRAYGLNEHRPWWLLRLESIGYVLVGAVGLLALAFLVVLGPLVFKAALAYADWLAPLESHFNVGRLAAATFVLTMALLILHMWLPAGRRAIEHVWPGIVATLVLWLACGFIFGRYLSDFSYTYVNYYAGLASAMTALVFLYFTALDFHLWRRAQCRDRARAGDRTTDAGAGWERIDCRLSAARTRGRISSRLETVTAAPRSRRRSCAGPGAAY